MLSCCAAATVTEQLSTHAYAFLVRCLSYFNVADLRAQHWPDSVRWADEKEAKHHLYDSLSSGTKVRRRRSSRVNVNVMPSRCTLKILTQKNQLRCMKCAILLSLLQSPPTNTGGHHPHLDDLGRRANLRTIPAVGQRPSRCGGTRVPPVDVPTNTPGAPG